MTTCPESRSIAPLLVATMLLVGCGNTPTTIAGEDAIGVTRVGRQHDHDVGSVVPLVTFPGGGVSPEGIALDRRGTIYVGARQSDPVTGAFVRNHVVRVASDGSLTSIAALGPASAGGEGVLGLATDRHGNVYAAFASGIPETRGAYRISRDASSVERLPGSERIAFPNGLAFDARGTLYVTDSFAGAIWRRAPDGAFEQWLVHPFLAPVAVPGFPPLPGVNGVVWRPGAGLFIANTSQGTIVRIPILPDGTAGDATVLASGLLGVDGLAARHAGPLYAVNGGANLLGVPALMSVHVRTGEVIPINAELNAFDDPSSVAFAWGGSGRDRFGRVGLPRDGLTRDGSGRGKSGHDVVVVVNSNVFAPTGAGASVVGVVVR